MRSWLYINICRYILRCFVLFTVGIQWIRKMMLTLIVLGYTNSVDKLKQAKTEDLLCRKRLGIEKKWKESVKCVLSVLHVRS